MKLYLISGMGADHSVFRYLRLEGIEVVPLPWLPVTLDESLEDYVKRLAGPVDTGESFALGGLSLGGICAQEMTRFLNPEKLVLISTIKGRHEMPPWLRVAASSRLQRLIPDAFYKWAAVHSGAIIGVKEVEDQDHFQRMLDQYGEDYYVWAIRMVAEWKAPQYQMPYLHLHGSDDAVFPARYIENATFIEGGNHYMIVNKARQISRHIQDFLRDSEPGN